MKIACLAGGTGGPKLLVGLARAVADDDLVSLRYVEVDRRVKKVVVVVKMRGSQHSKEYREYEITERGFVVGGNLDGRGERPGIARIRTVLGILALSEGDSSAAIAQLVEAEIRE